MWIQKFQIFKKVFINSSCEGFVVIEGLPYYDNQRIAFQWIDESGDKEMEYVILPVITFDNNAES